MFKTNLKIAWRNLIKDKQFTFLNVLGLSAGLACSLLIFLWVNDELKFDHFFANNDRLYQLMERQTTNGNTGISDGSSGPLSEAVAQQMPEVEYATPLAPPGWFPKFTLSANDKIIKALGQYAGKDYFRVFSYKLLDGNKENVLANKNSIVISDELAKKLFGTAENITGRPIRFQQSDIFYVSGVFEKTPYHSSQQFDFVLPWDYFKSIQDWVTNWNNVGPQNFVLLKKRADIDAFNKKIAGIIAAHGGNDSRVAFATRFSDVYLHNNVGVNSGSSGRIQYVKMFSLIALFILLIACINFMNLSTAKASKRMKEVGIKKVVGADRKQLIFQFLSESVLLTLVAMMFAVLMATLFLPVFNGITGKEIILHYDTETIFIFIGIVLFTGLLAGSYPALYLSKFNPHAILKGKLHSSFAEMISRKGLVVFQFTLSSILIIAVIIIYQQIQFIQNTDPGYKKDNVIRLDAEGKIQGTEQEFVNELKNISGVTSASYTFTNIVGHTFGDYGLSWEGKNPNESVYFEVFGGGYDFIKTMGMHMLSGRAFSKDFSADTSNIILNEAAVRAMNLKNPVGKIVHLYVHPMQVIGVVKDFHFESMHETIKPSYILLQPHGGKILARISAAHQKETIAAIQHLYESYNPGFPFTFNFLDEAYQKQYDSETRVSVLSKYFAGLAVIISCLGLFGLAAFTAQKRRKEIGIRKVIGASVSSITTMLSADFLKLILLSLLIAFPVSWWLMDNWLQGFAYRIHITPNVFLVAGGSIILITLFTIGFQSIKAAIANPVKSLRTE
jgi:putative ABC transport system permease protein